MTWQIPQSQTATTGTVLVPLGATDSVFVASGVTIALTGGIATIRGDGSDHEALIYGTVANASGLAAVVLGDNTNPGGDTGEIVTIAASGQVRSFDGNGIHLLATSIQVTNNGL